MELPADLLLRTPQEGARLLALDRLAACETAVAALAAGEHPEALHDTRVALRRLRSALRSWRRLLRPGVRRRHRRALAGLQGLSGPARDAEVGAQRLARLAPDLGAQARGAALRLAGQLEVAAARGHANLRRDLGEAVERALRRLRRRLSTFPADVRVGKPEPQPRFASALAEALRSHGQHLFEGLDALVGLDEAAAHATRIRGKRLRYLVEPFDAHLPGVAAVVEPVRRLQDELGALQDDVFLERARAAALERADGDEEQAGLQALAPPIEARRRACLAGAAQRWRGGAERKTLEDALGRLVRAAQEQARAGLEIERKFLLRGLPSLPPCAVLEVEQGWLPGERLQERLRRVRDAAGVRCWRTLKTGRGLARVEVEEECPEDLFERLWPLTEGLRVRKRRHVVPHPGARPWEIDRFLDRDLVLAEIELASVDEPVSLPDWLAPWVVREVTDEDAYVNRRLAR